MFDNTKSTPSTSQLTATEQKEQDFFQDLMEVEALQERSPTTATTSTSSVQPDPQPSPTTTSSKRKPTDHPPSKPVKRVKPFETGSGGQNRLNTPAGGGPGGRKAHASSGLNANHANRKWDDNASLNATLGLTPPPPSTSTSTTRDKFSTDFNLDLSTEPSLSNANYNASQLSPATIQALGLESFFANQDGSPSGALSGSGTLGSLGASESEQMDLLAQLSEITSAETKVAAVKEAVVAAKKNSTKAVASSSIDPLLFPESAKETSTPSTTKPTESDPATASATATATHPPPSNAKGKQKADITVSQSHSSSSVPTPDVGPSAHEAAIQFRGDEDRPHSCPNAGCNKSFSRKSDFLRHYRIHTGERPFVCEYVEEDGKKCEKSFIQRSALTVHSRVHSGDKPHACNECDRHFSDSSSLARHRRVHAGLKPFKCEKCGTKAFSRKATLARHMAICSGAGERSKPKVSKPRVAKTMAMGGGGGGKTKIHPSVQQPEPDHQVGGDVEVEEEDEEEEFEEPPSPSLQQLSAALQPPPPQPSPLPDETDSTPLSARRNSRTTRPQSLRIAPNNSPTTSEIAAANTSDTRTEVQPVPRPAREGTAEQAAIRALVSGLRVGAEEAAE